MHVDWMPNQGLRIDANAAFHAEPKFKFDVYSKMITKSKKANIFAI